MSYESKAVLMVDLEKALGHAVAAADMPHIMQIIADTLAGYDVSQIAPESGPDDLLDTYLSALTVEGRSGKTIERYRYILGRMLDAVKLPTRRITVYHLRAYLADEKARGVSDSTLEGTRQIFSAYFNWLQRENLISRNPSANLGAIKCEKRVKQAYTDIDIERLKTSCRSDRDRAIMSFLLATGCRISELTQLNRDSVDLSKLECKVHGKGNKERKVYLDAVTGMLLQKYLDTRTDASAALFVGRGSERLTPGGVRYMLSSLGIACDISKVHPHRFRRTLATTLAARGMPIQDIAAILGHEKLETTMKYIAMNDEDVKHSYQRFSR